jgi:hypothetical protein
LVGKQVIIENPVINSRYKELCRHLRFSEEGITDEIIESRFFKQPDSGKIAVNVINHYGDEVLRAFQL